MTFIKWVLAYFKPYTFSIETPDKQYRFTFHRGRINGFKTSRTDELRGLTYDCLWTDESSPRS